MTVSRISATLWLAFSLNLGFTMTDSSSAEGITWSCEASGSHRSYKASSVERGRSNFELIIYESPNFIPSTYKTMVQVSVDVNAAQELIGVGQLSTGERIEVFAFRSKSTAFEVMDATNRAIGHCIRDVTQN